VLAKDLGSGVSPEPIELRRSDVKGLCEHVLDDEDVANVVELADLCDALKRDRDGQPFQRSVTISCQ
jgi:hypothetical protein